MLKGIYSGVVGIVDWDYTERRVVVRQYLDWVSAALALVSIVGSLLLTYLMGAQAFALDAVAAIVILSLTFVTTRLLRRTTWGRWLFRMYRAHDEIGRFAVNTWSGFSSGQ